MVRTREQAEDHGAQVRRVIWIILLINLGIAAAKIVVGTVPIFCVAGFIESFMTRPTEWPDALRLMVIGLSLAFVIGYYIVLPYKRHHGIRET